uniref:KANL2-like probable zinc-finger domain-containing protein n=1 Tax=Strigamia maritima TaxID=126957 RepID=T1JJY2_STRMM
MMYEGKHIHYSPVDNKPLCSYSTKLCKQRRLNGYAFCIRHILEDKSAPFKQCAHVAKYNNQKCTNPIPTNEDREYCNSHMQVAGMAPKKERKAKKDKESSAVCSPDGKIKFADRLKALLNKTGNEVSMIFDEHVSVDDPYAFSDAMDKSPLVNSPKTNDTNTKTTCLVQQAATESNINNRLNKSQAAKSSKTMNRLQAKIAHNKVLDKLKKNQDCVYVNNNSKSDVAIHSNGVLDHFVLSDLVESSKGKKHLAVNVPIKKMWCKLKRGDNKKEIAEPLQRVRDSWQERRLSKADLHPLGLEMSDSESEDSEMESIQRHWFYTWDKGDTLQVNSEFLPNSRPARLSVRRCEMRRQLNQIYNAQTASVAHRDFQNKFVGALLRSTKRFPNRTAQLVENIHAKTLQAINKSQNIVGVVKRFCHYKNDKTICDSIALPHTRHCIKHIMYNVDQLLFEHCTAKFADNTQCCIPVFDICHELPLCTEHARKRDNYNKMSAEPKPKKPRKKTKPSALTRPPKRGKKKKRQNGIRPNKQSTHVAALNSVAASTDVASSISLGLDSSPGPTELNAEDISKGFEDNLDDDLEDHLSPGSIEKSLELPLDTAELANQASRLLEEHDFTEVLNKIPDDAFNDLFTESKNGDFLPTKEETEELERALAAVDKDVKSLEKLSADSNDDMSDLANSMQQIHDSLLQSDVDLAPSIDNLNVMTSSFSTNDLNSLSQVLSTITTDSMVPNPMPMDTILQSQLPGVQLLPELVQGQLQLQVPVNAAQATNFVLSPQLLGATFTAADAVPAQFPQTIATHTIPLTTPDGISISLQSQFQGIRAGQWILSPADHTFTPMVYQNGFPISSQPLAGQVSALGNIKFPFAATALDVVKQNEGELSVADTATTFVTVNGSAANSFPVVSTDSPKESVS